MRHSLVEIEEDHITSSQNGSTGKKQQNDNKINQKRRKLIDQI